jgi:hypothetical protein
MCFIKLGPYHEANLASRSSRTPARHSNLTATAQAHTSAPAHATGSQGSSWADNLLGFWSGSRNQTQSNGLVSEVEAYLLDTRIVGVNSITFWQVSDSDLIIFQIDFMFRRTSCVIQQHSLPQWTYYPFKPRQSHVSVYSLQPRKP